MNKDPESGLLYRRWNATQAKAVLILAHGLGAHSGRWSALGKFFAERGVSSYALELKGFGETPDLKGHIDSFDTYLADLKRLAEIAISENDALKVFLCGESLGALIVILAVKRNPHLFEGLICISPAFLSKMKLSFRIYAGILTGLLFNPRKQFEVSFNSGMCTRDEAQMDVMDRDEREHRFATPKLFLNTLKAQAESASLRNWPEMPVLFLTAGDDKLVDTKSSVKVFNGIKIKDKEMIEYPEMYHSISIDLGKEKAFKDILAWLEKRI